eukprot:6422210-Prorocentrum_lima.AAC.1
MPKKNWKETERAGQTAGNPFLTRASRTAGMTELIRASQTAGAPWGRTKGNQIRASRTAGIKNIIRASQTAGIPKEKNGSRWRLLWPYLH